ncbi:MAG TPA: hypothetical protein VGA67_05730 [Candidatus Dojkabacteria bacterium]|jgi:hypothetical protein
MKFLNKIPTRQKILISTFFVTLVYLLLQRIAIVELLNIETENDLDFIKPIILSFTTALFMFWIGNFRVGGERILTVLGFPGVGVFVFSLFVELIINGIFGQIGQIGFIFFSGLLFFFFTYTLFLTANIVNVSHLEDIPLGQAGRAAYFILSLIIEYLLFLIIISNEVNILIQSILLLVAVFFVVSSTLWTIKERVGRRILVAFTIGILITFTHLILSMWPIDVTYISFILLIFLYITLGLALEVREKLSQMVWIEYGLFFFIIFIVLIITSSWGINGTLV